MEKRDLVEGDILQLNPEYPNWGGQLIICTEPKSWGCQGYLMLAFPDEGQLVRANGRAFLRPKWTDMEWVGRAQWLYREEEEEE